MDRAVPATVLGVGTDLVDVPELRAALERQPGLRARLFCDDEWSYAQRHRDPAPHLAARFAAKEAVMKALGAGMSEIGFTEIEVVRRDSGAPRLLLHGRAASRAEQLGVVAWHLSLTHTRSVAHAIAVAMAHPDALGTGTLGS